MINKLIKWFKSPPQVYVACKMTGLFCDEMRQFADEIATELESYGIVVWHPVIKENIPKKHIKLTDKTALEMTHLWNEDKKAVKWAHVIFDTAATLYSTGAKREYGKGRYRDWSGMITLWPQDQIPNFIAEDEDDVCVHSAKEAAATIHKLWGTRFKRMAWRLPIYIENWHDLSIYKVWRFFR